MATTIGSYNVSLGLNVADLVDGSKLARNETAAVVRSLKSLTTPAESFGRSVDLMDKALREGAIDARVHAEAVGRIAAKDIQAASGANTLRQAIRQADAMLKAGTIDANAHARAIDHLNQSYKNVQAAKGIGGSVVGSLTGLAAGYLGVNAAVHLVTDSIHKSADIEKAAASYKVLTGSAEQARDMLGDIRQLASQGLSLDALNQSARTMLSFNVAAQDVVPTLLRIGNITGGDTERLKMMSLAFAQSSAAGRLMGQDLLQMINAGFNPLQEISRKTGRSLVDLKKDMESGAISFAMVNDAFRTATEEGGRFFGMLDASADTTGGSMRKAAAAIEILQVELGDALAPLVREISSDLTGLAGNTDDAANAFDRLSTSAQGFYNFLKSEASLLPSLGRGFGFIGEQLGTMADQFETADLFNKARQTGDGFSDFLEANYTTRKSEIDAMLRLNEAGSLLMKETDGTWNKISMEVEDFRRSMVAKGIPKEPAAVVATQSPVGAVPNAAAAAADIDRQTKALEHQIRVMERGESIAKQIELAEAGVSDADIERIISLDQQVQLLDDQKKAAEDLAKTQADAAKDAARASDDAAKAIEDRHKQMTKAAEGISQKFAEPTDKLAEALMKLDDLKAAQLISDVDYDKARRDAAKQAVPDVKFDSPSGSATVGSQEAFALITGKQNDKIEQQLKAQLEAKALAEAQLKATEITNQKLDKLADVSPRKNR